MTKETMGAPITEVLESKQMADGPPLVSVVVPCLNEEKTIASVLKEAQVAFNQSPYSFEILVADNGSTDRSRRIAREAGARIVEVPHKGYGAALMGGFQAAKGMVVVYGDADGTYDFTQAPALVNSLLKGTAGMVIGSRLKGDIARGAMPPLHRYLGTPVLTRLINILFRGNVTDCNSGFRAFRRDRYAHWGATSAGMEFASELIVGCLKSGDRIAEVPISLRKDDRNRIPHLSTWRDGMRHLLMILSMAPHGFTYAGLALILTSLLIALPSIILGPIRIASMNLFDYHSLILATLAAFLGVQSVSYGLILDSKSKVPLPVNAYLLGINEILLLKIMAGLILFIAGFVALIGVAWLRHGFAHIYYLRAGLSFLYTTTLVGGLGFGLFIAQVHKRA